MRGSSTPFVVLLLMAPALSFALAVNAQKRRPAPGLTPFLCLLSAAAAWSLAYALELASPTLSGKLFWVKVQYCGAATVPAAWLAMALQYTGSEQWLTRRHLILLALVPSITLALVWTNELHHLIWTRAQIDISGPFPTLDLIRGIWFWLYVAFAYSSTLVGTGLLIHWLLNSPPLYRGQAAALVFSALAPWVGNALYISGLSPFASLDLTPFGFTLAGLGATWGMFHYRILDIVPVARDAVVEGMRDGAIVLDVRSRIVDLNPAAQQIIGRTVSEAVGQPVAQVLTNWPELVEASCAVTQAEVEIVLPKRDLTGGEQAGRYYFDVRISPLYDRRHRLTGRLIILRDVTQRKRAEEALRESEARHRGLFEGVPIGLYRSTPGGQILEANLALVHMLRYPSREALLNTNAQDLYINRKDRERWKGEMTRRGVVRGFEVALRRYDGTAVWVADNARVTRGAEDDVLHYEGSLENITERVQTEEALRQRNRALAFLIQVGDELAASLDTQQITDRLLKEVSATIGARGASVWLLEEDQEGPEPTPQQVLVCRAAYQQDDERSPVDSRLRLGQGFAGWVALTGESVVVADVSEDPRFFSGVDAQTGMRTTSLLAVPLLVRGKTIGVLEVVNKLSGVFSDDDLILVETLAASAAVAIDNAKLVEELRQHAVELEARNEELDAFAHTAAHNLKNPLGKVVGYCELLKDDHAFISDEELTRYLHMVAHEGRKMSNIIDELLLLAGVRKREEVEIHPLDMGRIVAEAQTRLAYLIEEYGADVILPDSWPVALGYAPWVEEVWINYLSNAIKYGGQPPRVELGATEEVGGRIRFWVRDNGQGLTAYEQDRLFTPFTRLDRVRAMGHGLGLSIVRRIMDRLGGEAGVESQVGRGSVFSFTLPSG